MTRLQQKRALRYAQTAAVYLVGFTMDEVADILEVSPSYVWKTLHWLEHVCDLPLIRTCWVRQNQYTSPRRKAAS